MTNSGSNISESNVLAGNTIPLCLESTSPQVLQAFKNFVKRNPDRKWLIVSDYHREKSDAYASDVFVFTVLPAERGFPSMDEINAGLPCKLSSSKAREDVLKFLRKLNHFSFAFCLDKSLRPFGKTQTDIEKGLDATIQKMENWTNAAECQQSIDAIKKLRNSGKFNLKTVNHALLVANLAAAICTLISTHRRVTVAGWASDRDQMIDDLDRVVDTVFNVSLHAFLNQRKLPEIPTVAVFGDPSKNVQPINLPSGTKMPPLFYSPYVRIPDHFAAPIAQREITAQGQFCSVNRKYQQILAHVVADNPNIAVLNLKASDRGWGFQYVKSSLSPLTKDHKLALQDSY